MSLLIPKGKRPARIKRDEKDFLLPKAVIVRDPKWLDVVRNMPCVVSGGRPVVPAHIRWNSDGGTAMKPSDDRVVPLTDELHKLQHQIGEVCFWLDHWPKRTPTFKAQTISAWELSRSLTADSYPATYEDWMMECVIAWAKRQHNLFVKNGAPEWL